MGGLSNLKRNQTSKPPIKYGSIMPSIQRCGCVEHIPRIINPRDIFTKEMKDNTHFSNLRDSMMVSLQAFLKYNHNVTTHIISSNKILPYYYIRLKHIVPESLELKLGIRQTAYNGLPFISLNMGVLKGVESNNSWFECPSVIHLYACIMFPKIVENK